jgi:hypothetical protein
MPAETTQRQRSEVNFESVQPVHGILGKARIQDGFHQVQIVLQRPRSCFLRRDRGQAGMRAKIDTDAMDEVVHIFRLRLAKRCRGPCAKGL